METHSRRFIDTITCNCGHYYSHILKEDGDILMIFPCTSKLGIFRGEIDSKTSCRDVISLPFLIDKYRRDIDIIKQELMEI